MQIEFTPRGLLSSLFRQSSKLLTVFTLVMALGIVYIATAKPSYNAYGSLLIKFGSNTPESLSHSSGQGSITTISQDDRREMMQSNVDILQSHTLLVELVSELGPERIYPGISAEPNTTPEMALENTIRRLLKGDLAIKSTQTSNVVDISIQNEDPQVAAWFVHRLMELFIAKQSEIYNKPQTNFLQDQVKLSSGKLAESQAKLETFKAQNGISSIDDELSELMRQKGDASAASLEPMDSAWDRLSDLQSQENKMRSIYREDSPQVQRAHAGVELAQQQLHQRQGEMHSKVGGVSGRVNQRIAQLEAKRSEYNDLARQVDVDEKNYKNYLLLSEQARVNETLNQKSITSVVVVDEPTVPTSPSKPRKKLILALCLVFGAVLSAGTAIFFETYDQRFTTPEQLSLTLGIPVMACFNSTAREST
jgi:uncharacterized protein involved in exopolysaccharide biosynthesis